MKIQTFQPGEIIIAEGSYGTSTYLIRSGQVLICKDHAGTKRIPLAELSEGELFGEMSLLEGAGFRTASVIAKTPVQVELIPQEILEQAISETPPIVLAILKTLSLRLAETSQENTQLKAQHRNS